MTASLFLIITCSVSLVSFFYSLASSISFFHKGKNSVYKKRKKRMQRTKNTERAQEASMVNSKIIYHNLTVRSMPGLTLKRYTKEQAQDMLTRIALKSLREQFQDARFDVFIQTDFSTTLQDYLRKSNYSSASPHEKEEIVASLSKCIKTLNQDSAMQKVVQHNEATQ